MNFCFSIEKIKIKQNKLRILFKKLNNINEIQNLHIFLVYKKIKTFHFLINSNLSLLYQLYNDNHYLIENTLTNSILLSLSLFLQILHTRRPVVAARHPPRPFWAPSSISPSTMPPRASPTSSPRGESVSQSLAECPLTYCAFHFLFPLADRILSSARSQ